MAEFISSNGTFFDSVWTEELDDHFLHDLESHALRANRSLNFGDNDIFDNILSNMYWYTDRLFDIEAVQRHFKLANLRYHMWKGIMEHEGVTYDNATMSVKATNWTWIELFETFDLASAYHKVGVKRMWHVLNAIFGPDGARDPEYRSTLPPRPPSAFERVMHDGRVLPTLDDLLADIMNEEKRMWEEKMRKERKRKGIVEVTDPADCSSSTKGPGVELVPSREVLVISPELSRDRVASTSNSGNVRARRFLSFEV